MNRDLLPLQAVASHYPIELKERNAIESELAVLSEHKEAEDGGMKNKNRFKRYKKNLQKRARSIF